MVTSALATASYSDTTLATYEFVVYKVDEDIRTPYDRPRRAIIMISDISHKRGAYSYSQSLDFKSDMTRCRGVRYGVQPSCSFYPLFFGAI